MYSEMTYENILEDMLSRVESDVDKREGSIIYDAIAPCAFKLAESYFQLNNFIDLVSGDTAVGGYLDRVVADYGITRKQATKAIRRIETSGEVDIGTRWGIEGLVYVVNDLISEGVYKSECEEHGAIGNRYSGNLDSIDNVNGITAILTDIIESGLDEESDDSLRERFYNQLQAPSTSGNADNYKQWALQVQGVGDAKVFPLWNGPGTVKVLIVDSNMAIDERLEEKVYEHIEAVRPIGATVTVASPGDIAINVEADVILDGSKDIDNVATGFKDALANYLKVSVFEAYSISYAKIGSLLLAVEGIDDYSNLLVNNDVQNIIIGEDEMAMAGEITLEVV